MGAQDAVICAHMNQSLSVPVCPCLSLSVSICLYMSLSVSICLYLSLSVSVCFCLFLSVSICLCMSLSVPVCLCLCLSVSVCLCLSLTHSVCLCLSLYVSVCFSLSLSVSDCLSLFLSACLCLSVEGWPELMDGYNYSMYSTKFVENSGGIARIVGWKELLNVLHSIWGKQWRDGQNCRMERATQCTTLNLRKTVEEWPELSDG